MMPQKTELEESHACCSFPQPHEANQRLWLGATWSRVPGILISTEHFKKKKTATMSGFATSQLLMARFEMESRSHQ
jgi:hypothetical protein